MLRGPDQNSLPRSADGRCTGHMQLPTQTGCYVPGDPVSPGIASTQIFGSAEHPLPPSRSALAFGNGYRPSRARPCRQCSGVSQEQCFRHCSIRSPPKVRQSCSQHSPSASSPAAWQCLFGLAAEKVAGGVGVGHRVGVIDVEHQGKMERVGAGGQGFRQDAVAPDVFEADAARLVLVKVVAEGPGLVPRALMRESRTCRLAVSGQVARRYPSQASRALRVSSPRRCRRGRQ